MSSPFSWIASPPMWVRWVLSFAVAAALLAGLILWVTNHNGNQLATLSPKAQARENQEAEIVVEQDQAPQVATIGRGRHPVTEAIRKAMLVRIAGGDAGAPLQRVGCSRAGAHGGAIGYRCVATSAGVNYPYLAVLQPTTRQLTFCKHDAPPVPSMNVPVSPRCRLPA